MLYKSYHILIYMYATNYDLKNTVLPRIELWTIKILIKEIDELVIDVNIYSR